MKGLINIFIACLLLYHSCYLLLTIFTAYRLYRTIISAPDPPPLFGIYAQPSLRYPVKVLFMWMMVKLFSKAKHSQKRPGYGMKSSSSLDEMEKIKPLGPHPLAFDAVWFQGMNSDGGWMVVGATRRHQEVVEAVLLLGIPGLGTLKLPKHPDCRLKACDGEFGGEGLMVTMIEPLHKWRITYKGKLLLQKANNILPRKDGKLAAHLAPGRADKTEELKTTNPNTTAPAEDDQLFDAEVDLTYTSNIGIFDFDTDMNPLTTARCIAREIWTPEFSNRLESAHQTHYEQIGTTTGSVKYGDKVYDLRVRGMRDHTYGERRDWKLLHRYALHTISLEDGSAAQIGVISQPYNFSKFELGYFMSAEGNYTPIDWVDFELGYHGENGVDPVDYGFRFKAGGRVMNVLVRAIDRHEVFQGENWEARLVERPCRYEVDGLKGWGMAEWCYKNVRGRNASGDDSEWVKVEAELKT